MERLLEPSLEQNEEQVDVSLRPLSLDEYVGQENFKENLKVFIHAAKNKTQISYNIDADDILLCIEPKKIRDAFIKAEEYAYLKNLDLFNIDMFLSKSFGVHWSF